MNEVGDVVPLGDFGGAVARHFAVLNFVKQGLDRPPLRLIVATFV